MDQVLSTRIFVQTNNNQLVVAKVAKFALETRGGAGSRNIPVTIMNVDEMPMFGAFSGVRYRCAGKIVHYDPNHVQSFTLSRFLPPEIMAFSGRALVIDPDILALGDVGDLLSLDLEGNAVAACRRDMGWETSVMLLDCAKLSHWRIEDIMAGLRDLRVEYLDLMWLRDEPHVLELPGIWNSHDKIGPGIRMLHMTRVHTQPWKTGLAIKDSLPPPPPVFGIVPRAPLRRLIGKPEPRYTAHPDPEVERAFMAAFKAARDAGAVTESEIRAAIAGELIRPDIWKHIA
jgi:hypothetical protein